MNIGIVGAGAVGGFFGALLERAGHEVTFLMRGEHLNAAKEKGLLIKREDITFTVEKKFTDDIQHFSDVELVLFCVKANHTQGLAEQLRPILPAKANVLTMQNGVDNEEVLSDVFGKSRTFSTATYIQSAVEEPGVIKQQGRVALVVGALDETQNDVSSEIGSIFNQAGIDTKVSQRILERKWNKLLWNVTFNPLSALSTASIGDILDQKDLRKVAETICEESIEVAIQLGNKIDKEKMMKTIFTNAERARTHTTSMLQDRLKGKPMEVESICGYVVKKAEEKDISVPALHTVYSVLSHIN